MKNKAIITSLIIIMVGIIALGIGWHKIFDASATKPNLIECKGHIDKNQDMSCDICGAILSGESDTKYKTVKNTLESGTTIEVKGDMPSNAVLTTKEITKEVATNIAKRYIPLDDDKVLYAYDISMVLKNKKYQPENYGKDVNITLTNLGIEDQKDVVVMHILDDKSYEIMKVDELTKNKVSFKTTSFSTYIVLKVATYNVTFTGTGNFEVQTIRGNKITNSTELVSGTNFTFVVTPKAGYGISGITTSNGTITTNGDVLRKTVTIDNITQATTITVTTVAAPVVTKQPVTVKVNSGETAIYTVTAQNATTYEWQYRTNENDYWKSASEIGTTNSGTLTITNVTDAINGYSIRCMLSNDSFDNGYEVKTDMAYVILTEGTLQMPVAIDEPIKEESKMITEWTIPAANTTIKLPAQSSGDAALNITVNWGDGSAEQTFTTDFPTHTYATAGTYEIKVWGTCPKWGYASSNTVSATANSDYYTYTQYLTKVKQFGELSAMQYGFAKCRKLTEFSGQNLVTSKTFEKTARMDYMFEGCDKLTNLDLSNFDTSKVTNMSNMFSYCSSLLTLDLSKFNKSNVTDMSYMFWFCQSMTSLNLSSFNTSKVTNMSEMFGACYDLTSLDVSKFDTSKVTNMSKMFSFCSKVASLEVNNFDTSNVTDISGMFSGCSSLISLDISNFDTSKVTSMSMMFYKCSSLTSLDVSEFDTSKVMDMIEMFYNCSSLTSLDVSKFNTSKVTVMAGMFYNCSSLTSLDVSNFNTSNVVRGTNEVDASMRHMFAGCSNLTSLDVGNFDTSKVTSMYEMFAACTSLKSIQLSNKFKIPSSRITDMFTNTTNLTSIILVDSIPLAGQFTNVKAQLDGKTIYVPSKSAETAYETSWATDFSGDRIQPILELVGDENVTIDVGATYTDAGYTVAGFDTANSGDYTVYGYNVTTSGEVNTAIAGTYKIDYTLTRTYNNAGVAQTDTLMTVTRNITVKEVIKETSKMITEWTIPTDNTEIKLPVQGTGLNITVDWGDGTAEQTVTTAFPTHIYATAGTYEIKVWGTCPKWGYASASSVTTTRNSDYYTYTQYLSKVKQFGELGAQQYGFAQCKNLTEVFGDNLVTNRTFEKTTSMAYMFYYCTNLTSLDVSSFDTSNVTDMSGMFDNCKSLTSLDVSNLDTQNVKNMCGMFGGCTNLTSLDVSNFDTSNVSNMAAIFSACSSLKSLNVSNFDTSNVTNMEGMFNECRNLIDLDVSKFNTAKVTVMSAMFSGCSSLKSLNVSKFNTSNVTTMSIMFNGCSALKNLDLSTFNTSNVTDMSHMFNSCRNLTSLNISNIDTSNVKYMYNMFWGCSSLTSLDVSNFDTSKVTSMKYMLYECSGLTNLNLSNFDTSKVTDMGGMFYRCSNLKSLQLSNKFVISTSNNTNMFTNTTNLTSIILVDSTPLAGQFTNIKAQLDGKTFYVPSKSAEVAYETSWSADFTAYRIQPILELVGDENVTINAGETYTDAGYTVAGFDKTNSGDYTVYGYNVTTSGEVNTAVAGTYKIDYTITRTYTNAGVAQTDTLMTVTRNITVKEVIKEEFKMITEWNVSGDAGLTIKLPAQSSGDAKLNITVDWGDGTAEQTVTTSFPTHTYATAGTYEIKVWGTCPKWGYASSLAVSTTSNYYTYTQYLTKVKQFGELNAIQYGFASCKNLKEVTGKNLVTSKTFKNTTSMSVMFAECYKLTSLDVSNFDTSKVTSMSEMFYNCMNLTSLDVSGFDTSKVTNMAQMFDGCKNLTSLDVSNFNTSSVINMRDMFYECINLMSFDVSNFDTSKVTTMSHMFHYCSKLTSLDVGNFNTSSVTDMSGMFSMCSSLTSLDVSNFDTSKVTDMSYMFNKCGNLTSLNLSNFDTSSVTTMSAMFLKCVKLTDLSISDFDTSNVTNMSWMFSNCSNLTSLDVSGFDTSNVTNMSYMFFSCRGLTSLDVSGFNTSNVTNMSYMFYNCSNLTSLDVSGFDTSNVTDMASMFKYCSALKTLQLSNKFKIPSSSNANMFANTTNLKSIILIDSTPLASQFTNIKAQLDGKTFYVPSKSAETAYETSWVADFTADRIHPILELIGDENVTIKAGETYTDAGYTVAGFDTANSGDYTVYGYNVTTSGEVNTAVVGAYKIDYTLTRTYNNAGVAQTDTLMNVTRNVIVKGSIATSMITEWIIPTDNTTIKLPATKYGSTSVNIVVDWGDGTIAEAFTTDFPTHTYASAGTYEITVSGTCPKWGYAANLVIDASSDYYTSTQYITKVKQFGELNAEEYGFAQCKNLIEVSGENLVTSKTFEKVTDMSYMFDSCTSLTSLDVSKFDTSNVMSMYQMFNNCRELSNLNVSNFDTSNVRNMAYMFCGCASLTALDVSNFDTSKVTNMHSMFYNCWKLTSLDVSNFNTSRVTDMSWMFTYCRGLTELNVKNFDTSKATNMSAMFYNCTSLTDLNISKFNTSKVTDMSWMFSNCSSLASLNLSTFDTSKVTSMSHMFYNCSNLTNLDVSQFGTSNVIGMDRMFSGCSKLTSLDISDFDTTTVTYMTEMFKGCTNLKTLQLSNKFKIPSSGITNMFTNTPNLTSIILVDSTPLAGQFTNIKAQLDGKTFYVPSKSAETAYETSWVADFTADRIHPILELVGDENVTIDVGATYTDAGYTVAGLTTADAQYYTPYGYNVTKTGEVVTSEAGVYQIKYEITRTYMSGGTTKTDTLMNVTRNITVKGAVATSMITEWTIPSANTTIKLPVQSHGGNSLNITVDWGDGSAVQIVTTNFPTHTYTTAGTYDITVSGTCPAWGYMGSGRVSTTLNSDYYTYTQYLTKVKQFGELNAQYYGFSQCTNLTSVKGATKNSTSNVTTMANMFYFCQRLTELDLTNFDTLKVTDMNYMFFKVRAQEIDLSSFNTSNVTNMSYMFGECGFLTNINLSGFNTSKVTNMSAMFKGCDVLTKLDLSKFKTSKVAYMNEMFSNCTSLKSLKVSDLNFNTVNVINMKRMFYNCSSLTEIPVAKFNTSNVTNFDEMFARCSSLKTLNLSNFVVSNYFEGNDSNSMLNGCTSLRSIQISSTFRVPMSKMFLNTPNLTAIIVLGNTPSAEQFSPCLEDLEGKTFYVTDEEFLEIYRKAWAEGFSEDRIKPLLELKGSSPITITKGTNYVDAGYTIAGFTEEDEIYYSVYGYSATVKSTVDSSVIGSYSVTYTLKRKDSSSGLGMVEILMNVVRIVVVEEGNIVGLDIIPPTGSITVKDATIRNNINYVPSNNVTLEISAQDNISTSSEIKVYITTEAIDLTKTIADALWENYSNGMTKSITITNLSATTRIYALFKDAAGNTSAAFTGADTEYSIIYNLNGGTGSIENGTANYGSPAILSNKVPTKSGMYFLGWSTNASATVASYKAGGVMQADTFSGTNKNINLYAVWGNKPLISEVVEIGDLIDLPIYYNDLSGNNRTDWKVISKVENSTTGRSSVVVISTGIPLTLANTSADLVNDFFNMNNYSENGFENNIELSELFLNKYVDVSDEKPNVKGTKNGNNVYVLITLKDLTLTAGKNAYDKWSAEKQLDKITVSFNANGGTLMEVSKDVVYAGKYGTLPTPTREGYQFDGWYTRSVDGTLVKDTTKVTKNYNHTLYAHWTSIGYTFVLSFDSNGGTGTMTTQSYTEGKAQAIKANTFTKAGYTFAGWATSANGGVVYADKASIILTENTTLYAIWNKLATPSNFGVNSYGKTSEQLGDIYARWDDVEGATSYTIAYSTDNSTWAEKVESASPSTPIKDGYWPQTNGHYYVKVKANVNGGSSDWSEVKEIKYEYIRLGVSDGSTQIKEVRLLLVGGYTIFLKEKTSDTISISAYYGGGVPGNNHTDEILEDEYIQGRSWYTNDSTPSQVKPVVIELYAGEAGTWKESSSGSTTGYYTTPYTIVLYGSSTLQDRIEYVPMY